MFVLGVTEVPSLQFDALSTFPCEGFHKGIFSHYFLLTLMHAIGSVVKAMIISLVGRISLVKKSFEGEMQDMVREQFCNYACS